MADITAEGAIGPGERTLLSQLPDQGSVEANWAQNERVLLQEMKTGNPIRDATVDAAGSPTNNTGLFTTSVASSCVRGGTTTRLLISGHAGG